MKQTMILYPLDEETSDSEIRMHKNNWKLKKAVEMKIKMMKILHLMNYSQN